jgi:hypothetical protein
MSVTLACAGAANADSFSAGQFTTYSQNDWGSGVAGQALLLADYNSVFAPTNQVLVAGVEGVPGEYFLAFDSATDVLDFLPQGGTPSALTGNLYNPTAASTGIIGGDVIGLTLNVDFSNAGFLHGTSTTPFSDLILTNFTGSLSGLNGMTVDQFLLNVADPCLAGGPCPYGVANTETVIADLNNPFESGTVSTFADTNLESPSSTAPMPEPSSLLVLGSSLAGLAFVLRRRVVRA